MKTTIAVVIYIAGFVVTYGHAFNSFDVPRAEQKTAGAFLCAMAWPLYASTEAWK